MSNWPRVVWLPAGLDGCASWRMFIPHMNFPGSQFMFKYGDLNFDEFSGDVVVVQRQVGPHNLKALKSIRETGHKLIYDLDDNIWCLPQGNPLKKLFEHYESEFDPCVEQAHVVTVSTRGLALAVEQRLGYLKKPVIVCPNAVDLRYYHPAPIDKDDGKVVIGWAGSNTHYTDIKEAWGILPDILFQYEHVRMEFIGHEPPEKIAKHERVRTRPWAPIGEYPGRLASWAWDISLAPLEDVRFNKSKSAVKLLESSASQVPVLCSDVQPYREFCSLGGDDLKWLLCSNQSEWKRKLQRLVEDAEWRKHLGALALHVTKNFFNIRTLVHNWKRAAQIALDRV